MKTLAEYLNYIESLHPIEIQMDLQRVRKVYETLYPNGVLFFTISIAGTNGKGSTGAFLHSGLQALGISHGWFSSPHIFRFNERYVLNNNYATDEMIITAIEKIDCARGQVSLTYFEFSTLIAIILFAEANIDVAVMEVGLGGRLDSTNILANNLSIITSIGLDHTQYLGDTLAQIATEKSGIMRTSKPVIVPLDIHPQVLQCADAIKALVYQPLPLDEKLSLAGEWQQSNAALAQKALECVTTLLSLPYKHRVVISALKSTTLTARSQYIRYQDKTFIIDTAHNLAAAKHLVTLIPDGCIAIFATMKDKAYIEMMQIIHTKIKHWYVFDLSTPRALPVNQLITEATWQHSILIPSDISCCRSAYEAVDQALQSSSNTIVVFGSFVTISAILPIIDYN